ncbi:MAG: O-antigen ligase family protein, partial [Limisphaerales bacterium]
MNRESFDNWCEKGILALVLFVLIFGPLATGAVRSLEFLVIQSCALGVVFLWLLRIWINPRHYFFWPPICWAVLAFVGYAIVRYQFAEVEYVARQELIRVVVYAFLFFAILNNLNRQESAQIITLAMIALAAIISAYAIYQITTHSMKVWHFTKPAQYAGRGGGTYINPNHLAGFLEMVLPLGLACILLGRFSHVTKIILGYGCLMILIGIGVTGSRGGWIATGVMLLVFFSLLLRHRDFRIPAVALLSLLLAAGTLFVRHAQQTHRRFQKTSEDRNDRFLYWDCATRMWKDHLWWGTGPGHYDIYFPQYRPEKLQSRPLYAHNDYLNTVADWGAT